MSRKAAATVAPAAVQYFTHQKPPVASLLSVKLIDSSFCAFDQNSASTRYMIQWLRSEESLLTNPDTRISTKALNDGSEPAITVHYKDGTRLNLLGKYLRFQEMQSFFLEHTEPKNEAVRKAQEEEMMKSSGKLKKFTR